METASSKEALESQDIQKNTKSGHLLLATLSRFTIASAALLSSIGMQEVSAQDANEKNHRVNVDSDTPSQNDIQELITALDDDRFRVREDASSELLQAALPWIREHQKHLPWKEWLSIQPTYSTEQQARLRRILSLIETEELRLLWLPTRLKEANPDRENLSISQALEELEKHAGISVSLPKSILKDIKPLESTLHGYSPYEALRLIRENSTKPFAISNDRTLILEGDEDRHGYLSPSGTTCAQLIVPAYQPYDTQTAFQLEFFSENKILLAYYSLLDFAVTAEGGEELSCLSTYMTRGASFQAPHINIERPKNVKTVNVRAKVRFVGHEPKIFHVADLTTPKTCDTTVCQVKYEGIKEHIVETVNEEGKEEKQSEGWLIEGSFTMPDFRGHEIEIGFDAMRFDIRDAKGQRIPIRSPWYIQDEHSIHWKMHVQQKPAFITFLIPDRATEAVQDYFFQDVPMVRPDFYPSRLGKIFEFIIPLEAPPPRRAPR